MKRNTVRLQSLHDVRRKACAAVEAAIQNHFLLKTTSKNQFNIMKKDAKPILGGYACMRFPFFRILTLAFMLAATSLAWAQELDEVTWKTRPANVNNLPEWNGTEKNGTYKVSVSRTIPGRVVLDGTLTLYPVGNVTITRGEFYYSGQCVFEVNGGKKLFIIGDADNILTMNGGAGNRDDGLPGMDIWSEHYGRFGPAVACHDDAEAWLQHVIIEKFAVVGNEIYNRWGVISCTNNKLDINDPSTLIVRMKNVEMRKCYGGTKNIHHFEGSDQNWNSFGRVFSILVGKNDVFMENVEIHHNLLHEDEDNGWFMVYDRISGMGGIIRSQGNSSGKMVLKNCYIHDNQYRDLDAHAVEDYWNNTYKVEDQPLAGQGGAINWRSGRNYKNTEDGPLIESELIIRNCTIVRNCAKEGGAISTCAKTTFKKDGDGYTYISKNHAVNGGGLMFWPYNDGQLSYAGDGFNVTLGGEGFNSDGSAYVRVFDNYASQTGGGAYIVIDPTDDVGFDTDNNPRDASYVAYFGTGCAIKNNRAPQGAGVAIIDNAAKRHVGYRATTPDNYTYQMINPVRFKVSGELSREITIDGAHVCDNYTSTEGTFPNEAEGAGIYIAKKNSTDPRFSADFNTETFYPAFTETNTDYPGPNPTSQYYPDQTIRPYDDDDDPGGTMTVNVMSGVIQNNHARQYKLTIGNLNQNDYSPFTDTEETTNPKPGNGGGFYIASLYDIADFRSALNVNIGKVGATDEGLKVYENDAYTHGGGLYIYYDRENNHDNGGNVTVLNGYVGKTSSHTNKALNGNGGGLCVLGGTVTVGGGHVLYNTAANGYGGGIYVNVPTESSVTYVNASTSGGNKGTNISYNSALGGGGIYVDKGKLEVDGPAFASGPYGYTQAAADETHTRITFNSATDGNGGGIDAGNGDVEITNTLFFENTAEGTGDYKGRGGGVFLNTGIIVVTDSKVLYNTAENNGGGVDNHGGNVEINGSVISDNDALNGNGGGVYLNEGTIVITDSRIQNNTAENNGGGVNDHFGNIEIYGGDISNNKATNGNGGGIYTNEGDILVWPTAMKGDPDNVLFSQCELTKTTVLNNTAGGNGGGLNTHVGRFDVRFAQIKYNKAGYNYSGNGGGNGGGLFCNGTEHDNGYTVRLKHCDLEENKAFGNVYEGEGITGRGGGVYLKLGSIFAEHCDIIKNEADINGGGLDNHSGELRVYGSYIDENVAHDGRGGGLYTEEGNIVVGPCDTYGYTASKASRIIKNKAKVNGGGINNHKGDITIHGDRINENEAETGDGGGVYINEGNIFMYGGQINENKADKGKGGGVYGGSGKFNIKERKANPIVEILEVEDIKATQFNVHYHLVDRGWVPITVTGEGPDYIYSDPYNLTHGIAYSTKDPRTTPWTNASDSTVINYTSGTHRYVLSEGCVRVPSKRKLSAYTTYYVIAWAKYNISEGPNAGNYYDASPVVEITTIGSIAPVVATDGASVTTNSVTVSGELLYEGDGSGTVTKGIRYRTGENEWTSVPSYSTVDEFSVILTGLAPDTDYQAQAYATKGENTGYGEIITFRTIGSKAPQGPRSVYPAVEENPFFQALTPLQQAILASTPEGDTTAAPATRAKTGRDDPQAQPPEDIPEINENTAMFGGGICIDKMGAELIFSGRRGEVQEDDKLGQINENFASEAGGGIYIGYQTEGDNIGPAMMQMMGKCEVNKNRVPAGKHGGGIYLDGRFYVGDKDTDPIGTHGLKVDKNFAITKDQATFESELAVVLDDDTPPENPLVKEYNKAMNNIFLPRNDYDYQEHDDDATTSVFNKISVLTLLSDVSGYVDENNNGIIDDNEKTPYSHIGFSVLNGFCPVIATADHFGGNYVIHDDWEGAPEKGSEEWLYNLMRMSGGGGSGDQTVDALTGAVFEDSESYVAIHTRRDLAPFREKYIYLWGCWTHPIVKEDPERNTGHEAGLVENDQSMVGTGKHYRITTQPNPNPQHANDPNKNITVWEIYSPEGLAWFSSYVNGLNVFDQKTGGDAKHKKWNASINPYAKAIIMTDLDMSAYLWVPIGSVQKFYMTALTSETEGSLFVDSETQVKKKNPDDPTGPEIPDEDYTINAHYYKGTFDGQGHIIKGLQGLYLTGIRKFGLFGYLAENAVVKNTFVDEGLFVSDDEEVIYSSGGIAGEMKTGSVVSNSEARSVFNITYSDIRTRIGGLVGEMKGGNIHSSMAMPEFYGVSRYVGGLVGLLGDGCDLFNSFSNPLFPEDSYDNNDTIWTSCHYDESTDEWVPDQGAVQSTVLYFGGLVGVNNGRVENCYSRLQGNEPKNESNNSIFGWSVGTNTPNKGIVTYCYIPNEQSPYVANGTDQNNNCTTYGTTERVSGKYGFKHRDQQMTANSYNGNIINDVFLGGLLPTLNKWVDNNTGYSRWTRTMASPINDDYPILQISDFNSVGSKDGIYMLYEDDINDMWNPNEVSATTGIITKPGKDFQALNPTDYPNAAMYMYDVQPLVNVSSDPESPEYKPADVTITDNAKAPLYIHEDVGITQPTTSPKPALTARTGVTIRNARKGSTDQTSDPNWHLFSSSLYRTTEEGTKGVPLGIEYHTNDQEGPYTPPYGSGTYFENIPNKDKHSHAVWEQRKYWDPPKTTWLQSEAQYFDGSSETGYFPTNTPYGTWRPGTPDGGQTAEQAGGFFDLYAYSEYYYHWVNYKREGTESIQDHWHWDKDAGDSDGNGKGDHYILGYKQDGENEKYINDTEWKSGKGYLMALSSESMMMADGVLNTDEVPIAVTNTPIGNNLPPNGHGSVNYSVPWRSLNLIGNPYQSYLDFNEFVKANIPTGNDWKGYCYAVIDDSKAKGEKDRYLYYTTTQSENTYAAGQLIHPHQGFFVKVNKDGTLKFNNGMRVAGKTGTAPIDAPYRSQVNYPLVNLLCYDEDGEMDLTTVEVNRPEFGGGHKMEKLHESKGLIYAHLENESFQTLFTPVGINVVPVRFIPNEDGLFTLNWNTLHGEFSYLHLIDNITGVDVDCLTTDEYKFEGKTSDYKSRFKLVFRCDGDEPEDPEEPDNPDDGEDSDHFAFMFGDELVVNGEGMLQMFDVQGRCLMETRAVGQQSSHSLPSVAAGVYVFRLTGDKRVKVQKMVIK